MQVRHDQMASDRVHMAHLRQQGGATAGANGQL
jgi:hypothetical protein